MVPPATGRSQPGIDGQEMWISFHEMSAQAVQYPTSTPHGHFLQSENNVLTLPTFDSQPGVHFDYGKSMLIESDS